MKKNKIVIIFLVLVIVLSGCNHSNKDNKVSIDESLDEAIEMVGIDKEKTIDHNEISKKEESTGEDKKEITSKEIVDNITTTISGWDYELTDMSVSLPYEEAEYQVIPQAIGLSEQYESIINQGQMTGFTENQLRMLKNQGFVVMQPAEKWPNKKMHFTYERAAYEDIPTIITSDAVLNMYHLFYSESMKRFEVSDYYKHMVALSNRMLNQVSLEYDKTSEKVAEDLKYVYAYIAVGNQLLLNNTDISAKALPEEVQLIVDSELNNIDKGSISASLLYDKDVDYSQYKVRGHYVLHDILGYYFKGMMWYSQTGFQMTEGFGKDVIINENQVTRSLMLTHLIFDDVENAKDWSRVYQLTSLYSGSADDVTPFELKDLILKVYQDERGFEAYIQDDYKSERNKNLLTLRTPKINPNIGDGSELDMTEGIQFRLMGQRYSLDANILQELMEPIARPLPTAFDVLTAFGHPVAEEILYEYYPTNQLWPEYDGVLADMKELKNNFEGWQDNLYSGWLWSIDAAARSYEDEENYPELLKSKAWSYKNLSSALGSYAELKHDNILYSKQPMAEAGGGIEVPVHYYVEPNVELYSRLLWLIQYTKLNLELVENINEEAINLLGHMENTLETLVTVSIKELEGKIVTDEEFQVLKGIGGLIDYVDVVFALSMQSDGIYFDPVDTSALVADIATVANGSETGGMYVEEAIGMPREIYAVCYVNGKSFLAQGSVYSYYEFTSESRLTDDEWSEQIGLQKIDLDNPDFINIREYKGGGLDQLELMPWMASYISNEPNNVEVQGVEVNWLGE